MNIKKIQTIMNKPIVKMPKVTPATVKAATKSEQASADYFQKAVTSQSPISMNRKFTRLMKKLGIKH